MSTQYHVSKNGEPNPCHAEPGKCPLGGEHFDTPEKSAESYEKSMLQNQQKTFSKSNDSISKEIKDFKNNLNAWEFAADGAEESASNFAEKNSGSSLRGKELAEKFTKENREAMENEDPYEKPSIDLVNKTLSNGEKVYTMRFSETYKEDNTTIATYTVFNEKTTADDLKMFNDNPKDGLTDFSKYSRDQGQRKMNNHIFSPLEWNSLKNKK